MALQPVLPKRTGESTRAYETKRQIKTDSLGAVFDLALAPLHHVSHEGRVIFCTDGKTRLGFPILSAWIADHAKHMILHGIGSKSCQKGELPCNTLGGYPQEVYVVCDYAIYEDKARQLESGEAARSRE